MQWLRHRGDGDEAWISVSDMMAGLMMIFLFIAVIHMSDVNQGFEAVSTSEKDICDDLDETFMDVKSTWNMTICEGGLSIRLQSDLNFEIDSARLSPKFKAILDDFIPALFGALWRHQHAISELRIEGHTDSSTLLEALPGYIYNTKLSQERSRNVLSYALHLLQAMPDVPAATAYIQWSLSHVTAHGLSSSTLVKIGGQESHEQSRRVEFHIKTVAENALLNQAAEIDGTGT